jgi:large subunit ribosomal protein LP0
MGVHKKSEKRIKKEAYWKKLEKLTDDYTKALIVDGDNVSSKQISKLRFQLRSIGAHMLFGKNTLIKACLNHKMAEPSEGDEDFEERKKTWKKCDELEKLVNLMKGNSGIIFCGDNMGEVKKMIDKEAREAPAKAGSIAPCEVWIRAGPTGLDPKQTAFFQSLQI